MKIGQLENKPLTPAVADRKASASPAPSAPGVSEASAKVALSSTASQLAVRGQEGVFDTEKVKRISDAIRDGQFKVNPEAIADRLIVNAQELLGNAVKR